MRKIFYSLAFCALTHSFQAIASEGREGGGGGGICVERKCFTLAEAGLRINPEQQLQPWLPSLDVTQELESIAKLLPFGNQDFVAKVIGPQKTYQLVNQIDDKKFFKTVLNEYKKVMQSAGFQPSGRLEIFAVTSEVIEYSLSKMKTYILPSYNQLSSRQQALIIIHEALMREGWSLKKVLQFDGALLDYLSNISNANYDSFVFMGLLNEFYNQSYTNSLMWAALERLERRTGRYMTLGDFIEGFGGQISYSTFESWIKGKGADAGTTDLSLIKGNALSPNFSKAFRSTQFKLLSTTLQHKDATKVCEQVAEKSELAAMPIVRWNDGYIYMIACDFKLGQDKFITATLSASNVSAIQGGL